MPKNKTQVVNPPSGQTNQHESVHPQEPLSGSKTVKTRNHSHKSPSEGSGSGG
ncbi:small acid-soluble spore protein P [Paenibacillus sp. MBLB4367]|uniref:small acid-soluble spore protein P n=1 Tax=Paenibacillus sp. MBLB4367 TaxID=3384767 RepID=UPI00390844DA